MSKDNLHRFPLAQAVLRAHDATKPGEEYDRRVLGLCCLGHVDSVIYHLAAHKPDALCAHWDEEMVAFHAYMARGTSEDIA